MFAIIILGAIGGLYRSGHEEFVGGTDDPADGKAVAGTVFTAVIVYAVSTLRSLAYAAPFQTMPANADDLQAFLVFCGLQGLLHIRESRKGAIAL